MLPYKHDCAIHGMHDMGRLDELTDCALKYLDVYVNALAGHRRNHGRRRSQKRNNVLRWLCEDIRTKRPRRRNAQTLHG